MGVFGQHLGTLYTCAHILRAKKHTSLKCVLWIIICVRLESSQCIGFSSCTLWYQLSDLDQLSPVTLGDCRHLAEHELCRIVQRLGYCCRLPLIIRGSYAHYSWEIYKQQFQWNRGQLESLQCGFYCAQVLNLMCDAN